MSLETQTPLGDALTNEIRRIGSRWGHFLALGIMLIVLGTLAIMYWAFAFAVAMDTLGIILVAGGVVETLTAFWASEWRGFFVQLIIGILYAVAGTMMIRQPLAAAAAVTLVLALSYMAGGLMRLAFAVTHRAVGSGWLLINGLISLTLGLFIWSNWPWDSVWVIGLFLGIDLIFLGWTWVMLGIAVRPGRSQPI